MGINGSSEGHAADLLACLTDTPPTPRPPVRAGAREVPTRGLGFKAVLLSQRFCHSLDQGVLPCHMLKFIRLAMLPSRPLRRRTPPTAARRIKQLSLSSPMPAGPTVMGRFGRRPPPSPGPFGERSQSMRARISTPAAKSPLSGHWKATAIPGRMARKSSGSTLPPGPLSIWSPRRIPKRGGIGEPTRRENRSRSRPDRDAGCHALPKPQREKGA